MTHHRKSNTTVQWYPGTRANHLNTQKNLSACSCRICWDPEIEEQHILLNIYIYLSLPWFNTTTCRAHLIGRWGSKEISLSIKPFPRVRRLPADRSIKTDTNVAVIPAGARIVSAESCGISAWTKTAKVSAILPDGSLKRYFVKVNFGAFQLTTG